MTDPRDFGDLSLCLGLALGLAYVLVLMTWRVRAIPLPWRWIVYAVHSGLLLACPFLVPHHYPGARGVIAATAIWWWMKTWDVLHHTELSDPSVSARMLAILNLGNNVRPFGQKNRSLSTAREPWGEVAVWSVAFSVAVAWVYWVFNLDWRGPGFVPEYLAKLLGVIFGGVCGLNVHSSMWRLVGLRAVPSPVSVFWASSPADFWRRWNRPVSEWLFVYVHRPLSGARPSGLATVVTFAVSGLMHEYIVALLIGRITGCATAFFLVQGLGVWLTWTWKLRGGWRTLGVVGTWVFSAATSVLLFGPMGVALPIYVNEVPRWMRCW